MAIHVFYKNKQYKNIYNYTQKSLERVEEHLKALWKKNNKGFVEIWHSYKKTYHKLVLGWKRNFVAKKIYPSINFRILMFMFW